MGNNSNYLVNYNCGPYKRILGVKLPLVVNAYKMNIAGLNTGYRPPRPRLISNLKRNPIYISKTLDS